MADPGDPDAPHEPTTGPTEPAAPAVGAPPPPRTPPRIDRLLRRLRSLPEPMMRARVLAEALSGPDEHDALAILVALVERAGREARRDPMPFRALVEPGGLPEHLGYDRARRLYRLAHEQGHEDVCQLFLLHSTRPFDESDASVPPPRVELTLGERRNLARRSGRDRLDRFLRDPDPMVIENLLQNPLLTEREVLVVASRRPVAPEILLHVFRHRRWSTRYRIRKALVYNPHTPINVALGLLPSLASPDLREVARDRTVHAWVSKRARELRVQRSPGRAGPRAPAPGPPPEPAARPPVEPSGPGDTPGTEGATEGAGDGAADPGPDADGRRS